MSHGCHIFSSLALLLVLLRACGQVMIRVATPWDCQKRRDPSTLCKSETPVLRDSHVALKLLVRHAKSNTVRNQIRMDLEEERELNAPARRGHSFLCSSSIVAWINKQYDYGRFSRMVAPLDQVIFSSRVDAQLKGLRRRK